MISKISSILLPLKSKREGLVVERAILGSFIATSIYKIDIVIIDKQDIKNNNRYRKVDF